MIINISIKNFFSIRDEAVLDFVAMNNRTNSEDDNSLVSFNADKFIKVIGIFGSNAAGKSNIIKAIDWCRNFILTSHATTGSDTLDYSPFKFSQNLPTEFAISFVADNIEYEYFFALQDHKVIGESLYHYPNRRRAKIFSRDENGNYSFGKGVIPRSGEVVTSTGPQTLFLSQAASMNRDIARKMISFFKHHIIIGMQMHDTMSHLERNFNVYKPHLLQALSVCDSDIVDMTISEDAYGKPRLYTFHKANPTLAFDLATEESDGTKRLLSILVLFLDNIDRDVTLILDEFDLKLHLLLAEFIINIIQKSKGAQLVFTSHNTNLINLKHLSHEQIVFVNKGDDGHSEFAALSEYSGLGKNTDMQKAYLQGRFDGIPFIGDPTIVFNALSDETAQSK